MSGRRLLVIGACALAVFVADRITKTWVAESLALNQPRQVVGDYVRIVHAENTGAAFGLLPERTTLLSILSVLAVPAIVYYYRQAASAPCLAPATVPLPPRR